MGQHAASYLNVVILTLSGTKRKDLLCIFMVSGETPCILDCGSLSESLNQPSLAPLKIKFIASRIGV